MGSQLGASACVFLAAKVEENSKRVRGVFSSPAVFSRVIYCLAHDLDVTDILNTAYHLRYPEMTLIQITRVSFNYRTLCRNQGYMCTSPTTTIDVDQNYSSFKEQLLRLEYILLRVLGFELSVVHPQHYVLHLAKELNGM